MSYITIPTRYLRNGVAMPGAAIGSGMRGPSGEQQRDSWKWLLNAIHTGYRHIDTARKYGTEEAVAKAIKESGLQREDFFVTTKIPWNKMDDVQASFETSLKALDMDYVDLYLMHFPFQMASDENGELICNPEGDQIVLDKPTFNEIWAEFEKIYESGKAKAIGVSNFSVKTLKELLTTAKIIPHVNQVESHPYLAQPQLKAYCEARSIQFCAYTPTGLDVVRADPTIGKLAQKYAVTPVQIILAWQVMRGAVPISLSKDAQRQKDNITLPVLSNADFDIVATLDRAQRICNLTNERGIVYGCTLEKLGWP